MKTAFCLCTMLLLTSFTVQSQTPDLSKDAMVSAASPGKLLSQFTGAIQPSSFLEGSGEKKDDVLGKASKVSNASGIASTVASLADLIKPGLFKEGTTAATIAKAAGSVKSMAQASGLLKSFEGGLKPEAFQSSWSGQRAGWLTALNMLK